MIDDLPEIFCIGEHTREWRVSRPQCPALELFQMHLVGKSLAAKGFCWVRHHPNACQVIVCHEGRGQVYLDDAWRTCEPGMAILTPVGVPHAYRAIEGHAWGLAWVIYNQPVVTASQVRMFPADPWPLRRAIEGLHRQAQHDAHGPIAFHWLQLIHDYATQLAGTQSQHHRLTDLWAAVEAEPGRPWSVAELAKAVHLSGEHLRRLCHASCGHSPMQQVTRIRIHQAAALLARTDQKIETIAVAVGFANLSAFSVAFKRLIGQSPAAFRRKT
jgi:AraC-like DNA-binding protein